MTTSIIPTLPNLYSETEPQQNLQSPYCTLLWRRGQLWVKSPKHGKQPYLPSLYNEQLLVDCLKHSPVKLVSIDSRLGEAWLSLWAEACEQANKPIYLRLSSGNHRLKQGKGKSWKKQFQRLIDWIVALVLLLLATPAILALVLLMQVYSPGSIFASEWQVGEGGKLFRALNFRTTEQQSLTRLGRWMRQYNLHNLPQLFNVLQGDRGLIGSRCWTLEDAVSLSSEAQTELNPVPAITSGWDLTLTVDG
ncbi:sugar transferase [Tolypothrix sp. FACHB-123]|uniref:heterocyst development glycosyltransferase HepC n=1 Tax=Tolypothrix sp. FACHB-123 TaxID=2692868 RepID=UPI001686536D|nr:heterocyst development glycosyltransferase HepC [Tolypothrix sp. FACHB-123]MBD2353068.1 sugar transferase [Tolypothrix sp. FACHB-123]